MSQQDGAMTIMEHTSISGKIGKCRSLELHGYIDGEVEADSIVVHETGRLYGTVVAGEMEVNGDLQGDIKVTNLIRIARSVRFPATFSMASSPSSPAAISAPMCGNVPAQDCRRSRHHGQARPVSPHYAAGPHRRRSRRQRSEPDVRGLQYAGRLCCQERRRDHAVEQLQPRPNCSPAASFSSMTAARARRAGFDVVVADAEGATSGKPQTVTVNVER